MESVKNTHFLHTPEMAEYLQSCRKAAQISQTKASEDVGLGDSFLSGLERGTAVRVKAVTWQKLCAYYRGHGAKPIKTEHDPVKNTPEPKALLRELVKVRGTTKSSWRELAESLGVHSGTLHSFVRGDVLSPESLSKISVGLKTLQGLPQKLKEEGAIVGLAMDKPAKKKKVRGPNKPKAPSLIEHVPSGGMSLDECEAKMMALLEGRIERLRATAPSKHANGAAHRHG